MYAIAIELNNNAWAANLTEELSALGYELATPGLYIVRDDENSLVRLHKAIARLSGLSWLKNEVVSVKAFKLEDLSDFTERVKNEPK